MPAPRTKVDSQSATIVWRIMLLTSRHRWRLTLGALAVLGSTSSQLWVPYLLGQSIDQAFGMVGEETDQAIARNMLIGTAAAILTVSVIRGLFGFCQQYFGESVSHLVASELRADFYDKLQRLSLSYHDRVHTGNLMARGIVDIEGVRMWVHTGLLRTFYLVTLIAGGAILMFMMNWQLALLSLAFVPPVALRAIYTRLTLRSLWIRIQARMGTLTTILQENLEGVRVVRAFTAQKYEIHKFNAASRTVTKLSEMVVTRRVRDTSLMTFIFLTTWAGVLGYGGARVISGDISVGQLTQFLAYLGLLQMPVRMLGMMVNSYARATSSGARLFQVLDIEPQISDSPLAKPLAKGPGVVRFDNVSFGYGDIPAVRDLSFEVSPGEILGIVGPPGSGKSTIAQLVPRLYDVTSGAITIDGQNINSVTLKSLRNTVALVQQDMFLFKTTIEENIAYGRPNASIEDIIDAATTAQINDYVVSLPNGYATMVGERGVSLSGGQRQRLSLARSILIKPKVIIFDDSTAAIDTVTEQQILERLTKATNDQSTIIISHRLSSLVKAHQILVLDHGHIVERGTHQELLQMGGRYSDMYALQTKPVSSVDESQTNVPSRL